MGKFEGKIALVTGGDSGVELATAKRFAGFAATAIVAARELGLPEEVVDLEAGAVAHGHPIGVTGAVLTTEPIHSMRRDGLTCGLVMLCIRGGRGIALAIEALH
jgi:acetyl-CoA C-acetyltransferase